jgi:hypothetical protein
MKWVKHVTHLREIRNAYRILVREAEIRRHLERLRFRWEDNTKINSKEGVDWFHLAEDIFPWRTGFYKKQEIY